MNSESWSTDALWQKAKFFLGKTVSANNDPDRPFWCSLALEVLARSALSTIHPTLLAECSANDSESLLAAFGGPLPKKGVRSIGLAQVLYRLRTLKDEFQEDHVNICMTFANARNEEVHTGGLGFTSIAGGNWRADFYRAAAPLLKILNRKPHEFYGREEARVAKKLIAEADKALIAKVKKTVAGHRSLFEAKPPAEQERLKRDASERAERATASGGHRENCPSCASKAIMTGVVSETAEPQIEDEMIVVRQSILPNRLKCSACGLHLRSTAELQVEKLAKPFTRRSEVSPSVYYDRSVRDDGDYDEWDEYNNE